MITHKSVAIIDYQLHTANNTLVATADSLPYIQGMGNILPGMEKALINKMIGDKVNVEIPASEAFGIKQDFEPVIFSRNDMGANFDQLDVGMALPFSQSGDNQNITLYVSELTDTEATFSINHPLAGQNLLLQATIKGIRVATALELESGFTHGIDGKDVPKSCSCC
jgi:FKBP-type peptidyl-prolyl cis-trans isomerase SlyD